MIQILHIIFYTCSNIKKYAFTKEINLEDRYGKNTWVLITGCSSGQGKRFVYEFAKRNFNIILVGSKGILKVDEKIRKKYNVKTITYVTDFCKAYEKDFFKDIENILNNLDGELSTLVNNVGHRTAWYPYHTMPQQKIRDTIICGTIVQSMLTNIAINYFEKRNKMHKSCIINVTAMCLNKSVWFGNLNHFSVPFMSVYEAANAFGFFHSNSIQKEYEEYIDILNITPAAVITENTTYLKNTVGAINCRCYVKNIFKLIGNYTGPQHAYWKHEVLGILANFINSDKILFNVGKMISNNYMNAYNESNNIK